MQLDLGAISRVDANVLRREIAGPITRGGTSRVQIHNDVYMLFQQAIAGDALVELERLSPTQNRDARHLNVHQIGIEFDAGAARRGEDATPVWIAAGKGGFDERRSGDGLRNLPRRGFCFRTTYRDFDYPLRAFPVSNNLQRQRVADFFQSFLERAMRAGIG